MNSGGSSGGGGGGGGSRAKPRRPNFRQPQRRPVEYAPIHEEASIISESSYIVPIEHKRPYVHRKVEEVYDEASSSALFSSSPHSGEEGVGSADSERIDLEHALLGLGAGGGGGAMGASLLPKLTPRGANVEVGEEADTVLY